MSSPEALNSAQGYQLIATGAEKYLDLARNCAASLKTWDAQRPVQLVTDRTGLLRAADQQLFDIVTPYNPVEAYAGPMVKMLAPEYAVFEEVMFVDADCLLVKSDIDSYWSQLSTGPSVAIPGSWRSSGDWYGMSIATMCELACVPRLVQMNSGVIYFRRDVDAKRFFSEACALYAQLGNFTQHSHRALGPPDEPYLALAYGRLGWDPFPVAHDDGNAWMLSTIGSSEHEVDAIKGEISMLKGQRLSPTLCHFVGLQPAALYAELAAYFHSQRGARV